MQEGGASVSFGVRRHSARARGGSRGVAVCPQEEQCEKVCVLTKKQESVAIGRLERFVGD